MRDYVITVNSTVDVPKLWLEERHVPVVALKYTIDGETYTDMEGLTAKEFFEKLREGKMSVTSQVNPEEAMEALERRKGYFTSRVFVRFKRNFKQYASCRGDVGRKIS